MPVLLGHVGAGETQNDPARGEEGAECSVVELVTVICLERQDRLAKLRLHKGMKRNECGKDI